jgi:para-aminobenzoate synthetase component I
VSGAPHLAPPDPRSVRRRSVEHPPRTPDGRVDLDACQAALAPALLLESGDDEGWSYVVPTDVPALRDDGRRTVLMAGGERRELGTDPFAAIDLVAGRLGLTPGTGPFSPSPADPPFTGGLVGALAYDLGARVEVVRGHARRDRAHPDLHLWIAPHVVAVPPGRAGAIVVGRPLPLGLLLAGSSDTTDDDLDRWEHRADELLDRLGRAATRPRSATGSRPDAQPVATCLPADRYLDGVATVLDAIGAGDVFQVNLTQRLTARWRGDTVSLYRALRHESRAPYGACLPELGIASVSPETFLEVADGIVTTRPIKGTRPRDVDPALDAAQADDLATAVKDRAENVMVVDLERNDLGRVCVPGSVVVPQLTEVEAHPTVWHLVSTVRGELRPDVGYGELLRASFPCGSITGAPKVAAMHLIDALEPVTRGWYCGAIGFLSAGAASLSVAIRTATLQPDGQVDYGAGGGIVADSDPQAELAESLDKAVAFLRAVRATGVGGSPGAGRGRARHGSAGHGSAGHGSAGHGSAGRSSGHAVVEAAPSEVER